jgi:hypothetical protein
MQRLLGISQSLKQERRWRDLTSQYNLDEALVLLLLAIWLEDELLIGMTWASQLLSEIRQHLMEELCLSQRTDKIIFKIWGREMRVISDQQKEVLVVLNSEEIVALSNALNESLEHFEEWEFETRMGVSRSEVQTLLRAFSEIQLA